MEVYRLLNNGLITETERLARTITLLQAQMVVMIDEYLTNLSALRLPSYRQATASDYIVLASR
jgi:predicted nucleic-acid-binding protein